MKIRKESVSVVGFSMLYKPDEARDGGLDIVFVHGPGGHPVRTWLHARTAGGRAASDLDAPLTPLTPAAPDATSPARAPAGDHAGRTPVRGKSHMRDWASPNTKKGRTLTKAHGPSPSLPPPLPRDPPGAPSRPPSAEPASPGRLEPRPRARFDELLLPAQEPGRHAVSSPLELDGLVMSNQDREVYWPLDLLPKTCPDARVFTFGYETFMVEGELVPGQMDVFERGRQLLEGMEELRRVCGGGREVVFVAHSTGAIIVKEMIRLASTFSDTQSEPLLASIAGVVFLGAPLRGTSYGTMIAAMKSMASETTGVPEDDEVLAELLGGGDLEMEHLAHLGCESFDRVWMEFNFRVKTFRETAMKARTRSWAEWGLALRRDAGVLENNPEEDEDVEADHVGMCRFSSSWDAGYLSVSSFITRLAHHHTLRRRNMTERERSILRVLVDPECAEPNKRQHQKQPSASSSPPAWLLRHAHFQSWFHRSNRQTRHEILWLKGLVGYGQSAILSTVQSHIAQHWAPATHSSTIIAVTAQERESMLESVLLKKTIEDDSDGDEADGDDRPISFAAGSVEDHDETRNFSHQATSATTPAGALRSILSHLYGHDPRLRNLVLKKATTPLHGGGVFETTTPSARQTSAQEVYATLPNLDHSRSNIEEHDNKQTGRKPTSETDHESIYQKPQKLSWAQRTGRGERRWSDPTDSTTDLLCGTQARDSQSHLIERGVEAVRARGGAWAGARTRTQPPGTLEDVDIVSLFLEDYLCLHPAREPEPVKPNDITTVPWEHNLTDDRKDRPSIIEIPSLRRVFILVDATTGINSDEYIRGLLWCLSQLAQRSDFSICVATATPNPAEDMARSLSRSTSLSALPIMMTESNAEEIRSYVESHLSPGIEERESIAAKILDRSGGVVLWAEMVCVIVNEASEEGVSGEVVLGMLDDISPRGNGRLDDLYAWKLGRLGAGSTEQTHARAVFQWVVLAPESLNLNELLVALRLTLLTQAKARDGKAWWDTGVGGLGALDVDPPMSLNDLRKGAGDEVGLGIAMDSPSLFWRWVQTVSQGLLKLESGPADGVGISNEPLGLQRVRPVDESVLHFFLKGKGFQTLLAPPEDPREKLPSTERFIDSSYFALLHACLRYLSMTELDSLGREKKPTNPTPGSNLPPEETSKWRRHAEDQRKMVMSSYPLLRYAVDNLVFHLLCPRHFRYFLPQKELLQLLSANRCRIWRRWTHLLGFSITDAEPQAILAMAGKGAARRLLDPVYGAKYRLERVLKRVWKTAVEVQRSSSHGGFPGVPGGVPGPRSITPKRLAHFRSRSDVSSTESSMAFALAGGEDPVKSQWMVPTWTSASTRTRARANSSPVTPRVPRAQISPSPGALAGIQEMG